MRLKICLKVLVLLTFFECFSCEGYFTVIGSKLLRYQSKYHVAITSQGYDSTQILEIAIRPSREDNSTNVFELKQNVTLENGKTQRIQFDLKGQPNGDYNLEAKSLTGAAFYKYNSLNLNEKKRTVLVQTDKSIYKPADKVQFRVLVLDSDMKPGSDANVTVFISDGAKNRVKQFDNVKMTKGVFQSELQLSDLPVMGSWKIHVKVNKGKETTKDFEVAEYTLPKFEVSIDANPDANYKDGKIRATVRAKYTFGKIAKGNATVTAEVLNRYRWYGNNPDSKKVSKTVEVDGKKPVEFDIEKELGLTDKNSEREIKIFATFKEELTEKEQNATASVKIHITPHTIEMKKSSEKFKPGLPFFVDAIVRYHDKKAPVSDKHNPLKFTTKFYYDMIRNCTRNRHISSWNYKKPPQEYLTENYTCREEKNYEETKEVFLENGISELKIDVPANTTRIDVVAKYLETEGSSSYIRRAETASNEFIQIKTATENPILSQKVKIDVLATSPLKQITYQVIGKGDIVLSETVAVDDKRNFQIEFTPTLAMVPKAKVVVFYITDDGEIISDFTKIEFANELRNFINIELSNNQTKPGEELDIVVKSNPGSYVGLLGVDQSVLLLKKGNDIEESTVFEELDKYSEATKYNYEYYESYDDRYRDFDASDFVVITNTKKQHSHIYIPMYYPERDDGEDYHQGFSGLSIESAPVYSMMNIRPQSAFSDSDRVMGGQAQSASSKGGSGQPPRPVQIRKTFPETWLFDTFDFNSSTSQTTLTKKVPDTITSWIITGFSVDPITGLGLTRQPSKFTVFQPFFVSTNLPYSIKRGEVVSIPVLVFNYLDQDQNAEVTLFNSEGEFEFTEINEDDNQVRRRKRSLDTQRKKTVNVKSQSGVSLSFMIRPLKVGHITIKVVATSAVAGDGVERQLIVEPEGVTQYINKAVFIDLRNNQDFKTNISITIPSNAVPDSTKIEASAIGDILGPSIENLDKLIKLPSGCGEQNMLNFVPNIVVMDYLTTLNKLTPEIEAKSKNYMESGYQRELTYKHDDGSYSAFGKSDKSGSTWLTAFVAKSFNQAAKYILVDQEIVTQAFDFLAGVQLQDGSFPEVGYVSHKGMQGGASKGIALTAYTLITFLEYKNSENYKTAIDKALYYIVKNVDSLEDNYSLAIATYAMQLAKHELKDSLMSKLESKAENKNGLKYWSKEIPQSDKENPWNYRPSSVNVEMTAYALQALIAADQISSAVPIMKWLVTQRNENGGFVSTQDTVVGLQALSKLAMKIYAPNSKVNMELRHSSGAVTKMSVNEQNALILQKYEIPSSARDFEITASGQGFSILQLAYRYNVNVTGEWPRFVIEPKVHENSNKDFLHLVVCTNFVADESTEKSNMAVMEVSLPSGFTYDSDSLLELKSTEKVKKVETKEGETIVVIYFDDVSSKSLCPVVKAYRTHSVAKQKPAPVIIYDYYDSSRKARNFYNPPEISLCDICDGAEECKGDCEEDGIKIDE